MMNPYQPSLVPHGHASVRVRCVWSATILLAIAIAATSIDLPSTIGNYFRNGTSQNAVAAVMTLMFLSLAVFCFVVEWFGSLKLQKFIPWGLLPIALLTVVIIYNLLVNIAHGITVDQISDNPTPVLGWFTCPVVWYYFVVAFRGRGGTADNHAVHRSGVSAFSDG